MNEVNPLRRPEVGAHRVPTMPRQPDGAFVGRIGPDERTVPEPPIGSVIRYAIELPGVPGKLYTYVSFRAENGLWYTTGGGSQQNATWRELFGALVKQLRGPLELLGPVGIIWRD